jgi:hypothetical protein
MGVCICWTIHVILPNFTRWTDHVNIFFVQDFTSWPPGVGKAAKAGIVALSKIERLVPEAPKVGQKQSLPNPGMMFGQVNDLPMSPHAKQYTSTYSQNSPSILCRITSIYFQYTSSHAERTATWPKQSC